MQSKRSRAWFATGTVAAVALICVFAAVFTPAIQVLVRWISGPDWASMDGAARSAALGQLRLAVIQAVTTLGAGTALVFAAFNYRLTRRGQVTNRFTKALERLDSESMYVRLGGILALEQIVQDAPDQATHAAQVLQAFLAERTPRRNNPQSDQPSRVGAGQEQSVLLNTGNSDAPTRLSERPAADIQAALIVLAHP